VAHAGRENADDVAAAALAAGKTVQQAAELAGVSARTIHRRLKDDPGFRRQVHELRAQMLGQAAGRVADGMAEAADCLRELLKAKAESVRLSAARSLLELGVRLRDSVELGERIAALESALKGGAAGGGADGEAEPAGGPGPGAEAGAGGGPAPVEAVLGGEPPPEVGPGKPGG
jgi:hypothetical protein